ncbi:Hypothetical protein CINCED_3A019551 [Cinara cedri]|nr:Hypothetical protein CINCED_3A019551 [Cinara cedri]
MNIQIGFHLQFDCVLITTDWVCHVLWVNPNSFLTLSAHNKATLWSCDHKIEVNSSQCDEKCILYSATSTGEDETNIIIFSGTVFNEIIIWSPFRKSNGSNILHRLQKHEGVVFSISVNKCHSFIISSSDDRSIIIWNVEPPAEFQNIYDYWNHAKISFNYALYSHKARIWKSIVMESGNILSAGEDGQICLKTPSLTYQWEESRGSQVRSLDYTEKNNLVASGCTTGSIGLCSLNTIPKSEILADYASSNHYPKYLVVLSNTDTYKPLKVFSKIHSFAGVTAIWTHKKFEDFIIISSVGRDGTHRYWKVCTESETMIDIRLEILPTKWPFLIVNSNIHGVLICGFKESNLIVYNPTEQTILANVFCGGGHRAWGLTIDNSCNSIYFVCSSSNNQLERKEISLNGQHMLLNGFHSMIINSMAEVNDDIMVTVSEDTTVRLTRFNDKIHHLLTIRSHISSVRSVICLPVKPNVYIIVTVGARAQLKIWSLNIIDEDIYCEKSASHLLYSIQNKKLWRLPPNEGDMRFMDVCVQYIAPKLIIIFIACSDGTIRLYRYDISNKTLNLLLQSLNYNCCMLKMLKIQINNNDYILSTSAKGLVFFWNISELNYERLEQTSLDIKPVYQYNLHQSGINCCDWLELENKYYLLATGGDDQNLKLSVFQCIVNVIFKCDVSVFVHSSQVTGVKVFNKFVVSASVDQNIIFCSWSFDMKNKSLKLSPLTSYFTTVPDIHGLIAQQIE